MFKKSLSKEFFTYMCKYCKNKGEKSEFIIYTFATSK